jgi:hypothetical protein
MLYLVDLRRALDFALRTRRVRYHCETGYQQLRRSINLTIQIESIYIVAANQRMAGLRSIRRQLIGRYASSRRNSPLVGELTVLIDQTV